ncbi:MAG TPA: hypothetical protein DIU05_06490 [Bacteroidetes bacterium]|nr:hypothetical protein [Bacteroidota bacterium]
MDVTHGIKHLQTQTGVVPSALTA